VRANSRRVQVYQNSDSAEHYLTKNPGDKAC
jgi:hypothetical protein